jgi:glycosyltransferase involved in cell wall biosynthesis
MILSIITVNYNNAEGLKRTLDSVASQTYREFEHIIVDGGSSDESVKVIQDYVSKVESRESRVERVLWSSEPDKGIYDAMNKGVEIASGIRVVNALNRSELVEDKNKELPEYLYFLNGGDCLASPTVLAELIYQLDGADIIMGRVNYSRKGQIVGQSALLSEDDMSLYRMYLRGINHQSAFIKRGLLEQTPYDTSIKMGADWKFFVQAIVLGGATVKFIDAIFANYDISGVSTNTPMVITERENILSTIVPERIARDYLAIAPHYYEVVRIGWLLKHPFWYRIYRGWTTLGRKILRKE